MIRTRVLVAGVAMNVVMGLMLFITTDGIFPFAPWTTHPLPWRANLSPQPRQVERPLFSIELQNAYRTTQPPVPLTNAQDDAQEHTQSPLEPGDSLLPYDDLVEGILGADTKLYKEAGPPDPNGPPLKKILFWNDVYNDKHFGFGYGREPFLRARCRVNTCFTTSNRSLFPPEQIDALVWHWRSSDKSLPKERWPHTRYVFWVMESASYLYGNISPYKDLFNWTLTYRLDSDFPNPYGKVYRRRHPLPDTPRNYAEKKTKLAAWFVSNCHTISGRENLVLKLQKWIKVDKYGHCGKLKCERKEIKICHEMLNKDYKFYFSFENSLCKDYVTEKFFNMLKLDVVPVVYGGSNYSLLVPPDSYIDALSFPSSKALADHLLYLDRNDTAYNEYFRWKRFHFIPANWVRVSRPYCEMCERLHNENSTHIYNMEKWFVADSHCKTKFTSRITSYINS